MSCKNTAKFTPGCCTRLYCTGPTVPRPVYKRPTRRARATRRASDLLGARCAWSESPPRLRCEHGPASDSPCACPLSPVSGGRAARATRTWPRTDDGPGTSSRPLPGAAWRTGPAAVLHAEYVIIITCVRTWVNVRTPSRTSLNVLSDACLLFPVRCCVRQLLAHLGDEFPNLSFGSSFGLKFGVERVRVHPGASS